MTGQALIVQGDALHADLQEWGRLYQLLAAKWERRRRERGH